MSNRIYADYYRYEQLTRSGDIADSGHECRVWDDYDSTVISSGWKTFDQLAEDCNEKTIFALLDDGDDDAMALYRVAKEYGGLYFCDEWIEFVEGIPSPKKYKIQELMLSGWQDAEWAIDGEPQLFESIDEAKAEVDEFIKETEEAFKSGNMAEAYSAEAFRIVEVTSK